MSTETESARACLGWQCLMTKPENPEQAGWRDGYCPDCQDELARDEIRAERQEARNEAEGPTPITDEIEKRLIYAQGTKAGFRAVLSSHLDLERQLAESQHQVAKYAAEAKSAIKENERLFSQLAEARGDLSEQEGELNDLKIELSAMQGQRDRLAEACKKLMAVVGPPESTIEQCWAGVDEIDTAWKAGESALATLDRKEGE